MQHNVLVAITLSLHVTTSYFVVLKYFNGNYTFNSVYLFLKIVQTKLESLDKHDPINAAPFFP